MKKLILTPLLLILTACSNVAFDVNQGEKIFACDPSDLPCFPPPLVSTPGVVTILLALGDKDNMPNPTVDQVSARSLAEKMVQYASPKEGPRVLVVEDRNHHNESPDDFTNLWRELLIRYNPTHISEPTNGLTAADVAGYDVVWIVNPGHPMGSKQTHDTLMAFSGGVILSGDDVAQGNGFNNSDLTGLNFHDNGTQVTCNGQTYRIDDNLYTNSYNVVLDNGKFADLSPSHLGFVYGNDIDNTTANSSVEVLAWATPNPPGCSDKRPVVARYPRN